MILGYSNLYAADAVEAALPDPASARELLASRAPDLPPRIEAVARRAGQGLAEAEIARHVDVVLLGMARLGQRHGGFGDDPHDYHSEVHVMELAERRLGRVMDELGDGALPPADWLALLAFSACHDLRQRENFDVPGPVGGNEAASIAETFRILDASGFRRDADRALYVALELMIAGSTFDARPTVGGRFNTADDAASGGCLAPKLVAKIRSELADQVTPEWEHRFGLMLIAADIDTANVGEPFLALVGSAVRLALESQMRAGRAIDSAESAQPVFDFLTRGQERYFYELHRFVSDVGERVFGPGKSANCQRVRQQGERMRQRFGDQVEQGLSGQQLIDAFVASASELA